MLIVLDESMEYVNFSLFLAYIRDIIVHLKLPTKFHDQPPSDERKIFLTAARDLFDVSRVSTSTNNGSLQSAQQMGAIKPMGIEKIAFQTIADST